MPAIDFPASPSVNDEYSFEGRTWRWNGTGWEVKEYPAALLAGTAANPSLYFSGDPNTGLYSPGADQVAISTGGTGRLFVNSTGQIFAGQSAVLSDASSPRFELTGDVVINTASTGIGTEAALNFYHLVSTSTATRAGARISSVSTGAYTAGSSASNDADFTIATSLNGTLTERMRISSTGTTTLTSAASTAPFIANISATEVARIDSSGRLLVGTSSVTVNSSIVALANSASTTGQGILYLSRGQTNPTANNTLGQVIFSDNVQSQAAMISSAADASWAANSYPGRLTFFTTADGAASPTERLRIDSTGNVGLGTTAPLVPLDIRAAQGTLNLTAGSDPLINLNILNPDSTAGTGPAVAFSSIYSGSATGALATISVERVNGAGTSSNALANDIIIRQAQSASPTLTERLRIDSSGRLLVGASTARVLAGQTAQSLLEGTSTPTSSLAAVCNANSTAGPLLLLGKSRGTAPGGTTAVAEGDRLGAIFFTGANGTDLSNVGALIDCVVDAEPFTAGDTTDLPGRLVFSTTADGAASPTERMRISSTGAVGIGTSSPGAALDVSGNIQISLNSVSYHQIKYDTNNLVISANTGAANQTANIIFESSGAGGSMVSEKARIDSSGRLLVGTSTARDNFFNTGGFGGRLQVEGANSNAQRVISNVYGASNTGGPILALAKHRSDSIGGTTVVISGDECGLVSFQASDGTEFVEAARIAAEVDGTPGANDMPGRLVFSTTADGAASPTEQLRITNGGTVVYNQPAPAAVNTTATLTVANLTAKIITSTTAAAVTMTLPTGTDMDAGFSGLYTNMAFEWSVINTGATNAVTVQGGTGHTVVGSGTVAASNSGCFVSRRTAATTWVTYRLSS